MSKMKTIGMSEDREVIAENDNFCTTRRFETRIHKFGSVGMCYRIERKHPRHSNDLVAMSEQIYEKYVGDFAAACCKMEKDMIQIMGGLNGGKNV